MRRVDLVKDVKMPTSVQHFLSRETSQVYFISSLLQEGDLVRWAPRSRFLHAHVRCAVMAPSPKAPALPVLQVHLLNGHTAKSARTSRRNFRVVVPPRTFRSYVGPLGQFGALVFEHRLSAGTRVTSHHGIFT